MILQLNLLNAQQLFPLLPPLCCLCCPFLCVTVQPKLLKAVVFYILPNVERETVIDPNVGAPEETAQEPVLQLMH